MLVGDCPSLVLMRGQFPEERYRARSFKQSDEAHIDPLNIPIFPLSLRGRGRVGRRSLGVVDAILLQTTLYLKGARLCRAPFLFSAVFPVPPDARDPLGLDTTMFLIYAVFYL